MASWSDLPTDLLGLVACRLGAYPVDHALFAAVCRSWRAAVREHDRRLPWIVAGAAPERIFIPFNGLTQGFQHLPDGGDSACTIGSTDDWLLVGLGTNLQTLLYSKLLSSSCMALSQSESSSAS